MELRHLRYFIAVAEELHFARAAARLNIAAPTLSHQIRSLETLLGAKLLTRKTKSAVALTQPGQRFLVEARDTLKAAEQAERIGRRAARGEVGTVAIGYIFSAFCSGLISSTTLNFRKAYPDVSVQLRRMLTFAQFKALIDGSLDVGFTQAPPRYPAGLTGFLVDRRPYWLAIPEGHPLAARKQVTPDMLVNESFVAVSLEMEVGFWSNIASIALPGMNPRIVERVPDVFTVMALVAAGVGIGVLSEPLTNVAIPGLVFRKIVNVTRMSEVAVVYRKNESAPAVKAFIEFLRANRRVR
jgi:DNA-binding transcriptional LysR family regulator